MIFHPHIKPPYYAVIFANQLSIEDSGYSQMSTLMVNLAEQQTGYLGIDSTRNKDGYGITVSYWQDQASLLRWKKQLDHQGAQRLGRERWYKDYHLHVAKVEREYSKATSTFI